MAQVRTPLLHGAPQVSYSTTDTERSDIAPVMSAPAASETDLQGSSSNIHRTLSDNTHSADVRKGAPSALAYRRSRSEYSVSSRHGSSASDLDDSDDDRDDMEGDGKSPRHKRKLAWLSTSVMLLIFRVVFLVVIPLLALQILLFRLNIVSLIYFVEFMYLFISARLVASSTLSFVVTFPRIHSWLILIATVVLYMIAQVFAQFIGSSTASDVLGLGRFACEEPFSCFVHVILYVVLDFVLLLCLIVGLVLQRRLTSAADTDMSKVLRGEFGQLSLEAVLPSIIDFRTVLLPSTILLLFITCMTRSSMLNVPFLVFLGTLLFRYAFYKPLASVAPQQEHRHSSFYSKVLPMVAIYACVLLTALYISFVLSKFFPHSDVTTQLGFYDFSDPDSFSWVQLVSVLALYLFCVYIWRALQYHNAVHKLVVSTRDFRGESSRSFPLEVKNMTFFLADKYGLFVCCCLLVLTAVIFVDLVDFLLMCIGFVGLFIKFSQAEKVKFLRVAFGVCLPVVFMDYVYGIFADESHGEALDMLSNIMHFVSLSSIALAHVSVLRRLNVPDVSSETVSASSPATAINSDADQEVVVHSSAVIQWRFYCSEAFFLIVRNFDRATLLVVYIAALADVSVMHAAYLTFFLVFFIFRDLSRRFWKLLVLFSMAMLGALYIYYIVTQLGATHDQWAELVGFEKCSSFSCSAVMFWHAVVVLASSLQLRMFRSKHYIEAVKHSISVPLVFAVPASLVVTYFWMFIRSLLIEPDPSLTNLGTFVCLLMFLLCHMFLDNPRQVLRPAFVLTGLYSALVLMFRYLYQFKQLQATMDADLASSTVPAAQIGLVHYGQNVLFLHLLPDVILFLRIIASSQMVRVAGTVPSAVGIGVLTVGLPKVLMHPASVFLGRVLRNVVLVHARNLFLLALAVCALVEYSFLSFLFIIFTVFGLFCLAAGKHFSYRAMATTSAAACLLFFYVYRFDFYPSVRSPGVWWWLGLRPRTATVLENGGWAFFLVIVAGVVLARIRVFQSKNPLYDDMSTVFPIAYKDYDNVLKSWPVAVAYAIDHLYEAWCFELTLITMIVVAVALSSLLSVLYLICILPAFLIQPRARIILWSCFQILFSFILVLQYFLHLGLPRNDEKPDSSFVDFAGTESSQWQQFLTVKPYHKYVYVASFAVLFSLALTVRVLKRLRDREERTEVTAGTATVPLKITVPEQSELFTPRTVRKGSSDWKPAPSRSFLERLRGPLLSASYYFWIVWILIIALAQAPSLFNLGYITICCALLIRSRVVILRRGRHWWNVLGIYAFLVILCKIIFQVPWEELHNTDWRQNAIGLFQAQYFPEDPLSVQRGAGGDILVAVAFLIQRHVFASDLFSLYVVKKLKRERHRAPIYALYSALLRESKALSVSIGEEVAKRERRRRLATVRQSRSHPSDLEHGLTTDKTAEHDAVKKAITADGENSAVGDAYMSVEASSASESTAVKPASPIVHAPRRKHSFAQKGSMFAWNIVCSVCQFCIRHSEPHPSYAIDFLWNAILYDSTVADFEKCMQESGDVAVFRGLSKRTKKVRGHRRGTKTEGSEIPFDTSLLWRQVTQKLTEPPSAQEWRSLTWRTWFFLRAFILSHLQHVCYAVFIVNYLAHGSLISLIFPLATFYFALCYVPLPPHRFWLALMWILSLTIMAKYVFALPIMCVCHGPSGNSLHMHGYCDTHTSECNYSPELQDTAVLWEPFIGVVQYPLYRTSFFEFLLWDFVAFLSIFYFRRIQRKKGQLLIEYSSATIVETHFGSRDSDLKLAHAPPLVREVVNFHSYLLSAHQEVVQENAREEDRDKMEKMQAEGQETMQCLASSWSALPLWKRISIALLPASLLRRLFPQKSSAEEQKDMEEQAEKEAKRKYFPGVDLFSMMMFAEMFSMIVLLFAYDRLFREGADKSQASSADEGIASSISQSQISGIFVIAFICQVFFLIADRMFYVQRSTSRKRLMHFVLCIPLYLIVLPYWVSYDVHNNSDTSNSVRPSSSSSSSSSHSTLVLNRSARKGDPLGDALPLGSQNPFFVNLSLLFLISFKCIYLSFSSAQIGYSYPRLFVRSLDFSSVGHLLFVLKRSIPFIFEIRALIDWTTLRTSLKLFEWLKVEDVFAEVYKRKCDVEDRKSKDRRVGDKQSMTSKLFSGLLLLLIILLVLFVPLIYYSSLNPVLASNFVRGVEVEVGITSFPPLYQCSRPKLLESLDDSAARSLVSANRDLSELLSQTLDKQLMSMTPFSDSTWSISPGSRSELVSALSDTNSRMQVSLSAVFARNGPADNRDVDIKIVSSISSQQKQQMLAALNSSQPSSILLPQLYSPFFRLKPYDSPSLMDSSSPPTVSCTLTKFGAYLDAANPEYWGLTCIDTFALFGKAGAATGLFFVTGSDEIPKSTGVTAAIQSYSIIAFYVTFVLAIGRFLRMSVSNLAQRIIVEDLPEPAEIIRLVMMIYEARDQRDLVLEELLFRELILIYRSPDTLMRLTEDKSATDRSRINAGASTSTSDGSNSAKSKKD